MRNRYFIKPREYCLPPYTAFHSDKDVACKEAKGIAEKNHISVTVYEAVCQYKSTTKVTEELITI